MTLYDRIGVGYAAHRRPDPRVAARLHAHLGGATRVLNVGAGAGSYEPPDRAVVAVEPSATMVAQRPADAAPAVRGTAEHLPFTTGAFDAALAVFTVHHWGDPAAGLAEVRRVTTGPVIVLTWEPRIGAEYWLVEEYVPAVAAFDATVCTPAAILASLGGGTVEPLPVPHDCTDGFLASYWRRPEAYLDPGVRAAISGLARLDRLETDEAMAKLASDLADGTWRRRHGHLLDLAEWDVGYRIVVSSGRPA